MQANVNDAIAIDPYRSTRRDGSDRAAHAAEHARAIKFQQAILS
jgi:hypothetical protein